MAESLRALHGEALTLDMRSEIHQHIYQNLLPLVLETEAIIKTKKAREWETIALSIVAEVESRERDSLMDDITAVTMGDANQIHAFIDTLKPKCIAIKLMYRALVEAFLIKAGRLSISSATGGSSSQTGIPQASLKVAYAIGGFGTEAMHTSVFGSGSLTPRANPSQFDGSHHPKVDSRPSSPFAASQTGSGANSDFRSSSPFGSVSASVPQASRASNSGQSGVSAFGKPFFGNPPTHQSQQTQNSISTMYVAIASNGGQQEAKRLQLAIFVDMFSNELDLRRITALEQLENNSLKHLKKINNFQKRLKRIGEDEFGAEDYDPVLKLWHTLTKQVLDITTKHSL